MGGTSAQAMPKRCQELRMLSTYVLVHQIHAEVFDKYPLHVISENNYDSTLPLAHAVTAKESKKDLINTQAIYARGLVQALAFPTMQPAVAQLFHDCPGNPSLKLFRVGHSLIQEGLANFGDITRTITEHKEMRGAICLGWVAKDGTSSVVPKPEEEHDFVDGDVLVIIERGFDDSACKNQRTWSEGFVTKAKSKASVGSTGSAAKKKPAKR